MTIVCAQRGEDVVRPTPAFDLSARCRSCGGAEVRLVFDIASYPSCAWANIDLECACGQTERLMGDR